MTKKLMAVVMFFAFAIMTSTGCGGGGSGSSNGSNPNGEQDVTLEKILEEGSVTTVGFTYFGESASATFKNHGEVFELTEKGGSFSDAFSNANAWWEESSFIVQLYLIRGWEMAMVSATSEEDNLPADDVWEIQFDAGSETYSDRLRTGVFANSSRDFYVTSLRVDSVDILYQLDYKGNNESENDAPGGNGDPSEEPGEQAVHVDVESVSLNRSSVAIPVGTSTMLTATIEPTTATNKTVSWSSSNSNVASVENGRVTAKAVGTATIKATAGNKEATCSVTVNPVSYTVTVGSITNGTVTANPTSATAGTQVTLTVTPSAWYELDTLTVTDANNSNVAVSNNKFNMPASNVTVTATFKLSTVAVTSVSLNSTDIALGIGQFATLVATVSPDNATDKSVVWTTSSSDIVSVDQSGKVTAIAKGTATITATAGGKSATCTVNVGVVYLSRSYDMTTLKVVTETKAAVDYELVTASTCSFEDGKFYVVSGEVAINSYINTTGTAHLILCNGAKLTSNIGIDIGNNNTLNIYAQSDASAGMLDAKGYSSNAAIGNTGGTLYIHGGVINATGGNSDASAGAGIGGAADCGGCNVYIYGGTVTATGGSVTSGYGTATGMGIGAGSGENSTNHRNLTVANGLIAYGSDDNVTPYYIPNPQTTRYRFMKVEPQRGGDGQ